MISNISGVIAVGGVSQWLITPEELASSWCVQNLDESTDLYIREDGMPASDSEGSLKIPPGALYETPASYITAQSYNPLPVSIFSTLTGHKFTARRY